MAGPVNPEPVKSKNITSPMKFSPRKIVRLLTAALMLAPLASAAAADNPDGGFTTFASDGAWCWFSDPRAIYRNGKIYAGWITSDGSVQIGAMTAATGVVQTATLTAKFEKDDHDNPSLLFLPDGRLAVFYSKHTNSRGDIHLRITSKPEDIGEWTPDRELGFLIGGKKGCDLLQPGDAQRRGQRYLPLLARRGLETHVRRVQGSRPNVESAPHGDRASRR